MITLSIKELSLAMENVILPQTVHSELEQRGYTYVKTLGKGGFASVHEVENVEDNTRYAIKITKQDDPYDDIGFEESIIREMDVYGRIGHPNLITPLKIFMAGGRAYYVFPLCDEDLFDWLRKEKEEEDIERCRQYAFEIAQALRSLHQNGVIHCDIKPENVFLHENSAILADFGCVTYFVHHNKEKNNRTYNSNYRPWEIMLKNGSYSYKADMWAYGCMLWEFLSGHELFRARPAGKRRTVGVKDMVSLKLRNREMALGREAVRRSGDGIANMLPDDILDVWLDLINKCIIRNPSQRLSSDSVLRHDLFAGLGLAQSSGSLQIRQPVNAVPDIDEWPRKRKEIIELLKEVNYLLRNGQSTWVLAVEIFDRLHAFINESNTFVVSMACLTLATKLDDERFDKNPMDIVFILKRHKKIKVTQAEIIEMEKLILENLQFRLYTPNLYTLNCSVNSEEEIYDMVVNQIK